MKEKQIIYVKDWIYIYKKILNISLFDNVVYNNNILYFYCGEIKMG